MRTTFRAEIHDELVDAVKVLADRYARFGITLGEVVELCFYQGITKTRLGLEKMEAARAAALQPFVPKPLNAND